MNKPELVNGFNGQDTFGHVKLRNVFRKGIVFDQPMNSDPVSANQSILIDPPGRTYMVIKSPPGKNSMTR